MPRWAVEGMSDEKGAEVFISSGMLFIWDGSCTNLRLGPKLYHPLSLRIKMNGIGRYFSKGL